MDKISDTFDEELAAADAAEDRWELAEILADANKIEDEDAKLAVDEDAAAEHFGDPPVDSVGMTPDPKPDSYYAGRLGMAPPPVTLMLEKIRVALKTHVSPAVLDQMKFNHTYDPVTDKIMVEIGMYLFSNKIHTETTKEAFPAGWFQGFKQSFFPGWLQRKFPVKYTQVFKEVKTIHICPHLNYRTRDEEKYHLQFLIPEGDLTRYSA